MAHGVCSGCGKQVTRRPESKPEITCHECRRKRPGYRARPEPWVAEQCTCPICGDAFTQQRARQRYCTVVCRSKHQRGDSEKRRQRERQRIRPARTCPVCGEQYHPTGGKQKACSRRCAWQLRPTTRVVWPTCKVYFPTCTECGTRFTARMGSQRVCTSACLEKRGIRRTLERYHSDPEFRDRVLSAAHARRADKLGLASQAVLLSYLIKRDRRVCGLCHRPVRAKRGPMRPSIDHILPLSRGGTHELENVQLSHYRCNLEKNNGGGGEQLLLLG